MPLQQVDVESLRASVPTHGSLAPTTSQFFEGDLTDVELQALIGCLRACDALFAADTAVLLIGYGSQVRQTYDELASTEGVTVLWRAPYVPLLLRPLALIAAVYGGLVHVTTPDGLASALASLSSLGMVELFAVPDQLAPAFCAHVESQKWRSRGLSVAAQSDAYFSFGVDGDSGSSESGLYGWMSWGAAAHT